MSVPLTHSARGKRAGFTMIEVLAAVLLTSIVIGVAIAFQINLGNSMQATRERLRTERLAVALLDRIARDLRGAYYIVPSEGGDLRAHPWIFKTEHQFAEPETPPDAFKFITRNYQSQGLDEHSSDLAVVSYFLNPMPDAPAFELLRWRNPHMPMVYDPSFPTADDPDTLVMGEGISKFGITLIDEAGAEVPRWDSVRVGSRRGLPNAVRLQISMVDPAILEQARFFEEESVGIEDDLSFSMLEGEGEGDEKIFTKLVVLPLSPLDWTFLESEIDTSAADAGETDMDGDGIPDFEDDDIDGDGIPNEDDDDNFSEDETEEFDDRDEGFDDEEDIDDF